MRFNSTDMLRRYASPTASSLRVEATTADRSRGYGFVLVVLVFASKVDVRHRDPQLALQGSVDAQIAVELVVWAVAATWVAARLMAHRRWLFLHFPRGLGPGLQVYLIIGALAGLTALLGTSALTVVRAGQLLVLLALAVLVQREVAVGRASIMHTYRAAARTLLVGVGILMALSLVLTGSAGPPEAQYEFARYRLLQMHPIASAQFLGLGLLVCVLDLLAGLRPIRGREQALLVTISLVFAAGLWATKARGALIATLLAILVVLVLTPDRRRRGVAVFIAGLTAVPLMAGAFDQGISRSVLRGQTQEQLASLSGRTELFAHAWQLVLERPLFGHGYLAGRRLFLERFAWAGESHNAFVDIAISLGLLGVLLYVGLLITCATPLARRVRRHTCRHHVVVGVAFLIWLLVDGLVSDSFGGPIGSGVLALLVVVLVSDDLRTLRSGDARLRR